MLDNVEDDRASLGLSPPEADKLVRHWHSVLENTNQITWRLDFIAKALSLTEQ